MSIRLAAAAFALVCSGPAFASAATPENAQSSITLDGGKAAASTTKAKSKRDPDEVICRRSNDHSSRLGRKRICMTRAKYEERRMLDRAGIERGQTLRRTW